MSRSQFLAPPASRPDRVADGVAHAGAFEVLQRGLRGAALARDLAAELGGRFARLEHHSGGAQTGILGQLERVNLKALPSSIEAQEYIAAQDLEYARAQDVKESGGLLAGLAVALALTFANMPRVIGIHAGVIGLAVNLAICLAGVTFSRRAEKSLP